MKSVQVDAFCGHHKVLANYKNEHILAESVVSNAAEPFVVWNISGDGEPYGGSYFADPEMAQQEFCERCFGEWFQPAVDTESLLVDKQEFETHWTARYHGWFLAQQTSSEDSDVLCFLPGSDWEDSIFPDWDYLTDTYEAEWQAGSLQEAMDFIDSY